MKIYKNYEESLSQAEDYAQIEKEIFLLLPKQLDVHKLIIHQTNNSFDSYDELINSNNEYRITGTCYPFAKKFLTVKGKILPCENVGHQFSFGCVTDDKVNIDLEEVANSYNDYCGKLQNMCLKCYNNINCDQCLYFLNIKDEKPVCEGFMHEKNFKSFISSRVELIEEKPLLYCKLITINQTKK